MSDHNPSRLRDASARLRVVVAVAVGLVVSIGIAALAARWQFTLLLGWMAGAAVFLLWMWATLWPMSGTRTRAHACREDPGQATSDLVILGAAVASLGAVGLFLSGGSSAGSDKVLTGALSALSVGLAWAIVHTVFTARYARLFYVDGAGGISFNEDAAPRYRDFAYLAFTVGMTFQVSDTDVSRQAVRDEILRHMLLSYLLGAVVIAATINLVSGLAK